MKTILILLPLFLISLQDPAAITEYEASKDVAYLLVAKKTTSADLQKIAATFKKNNNIDLDFSKCTFDKDGHIDYFHLEVDCNDGFKGGVSKKMELVNLKKPGFFRRYLDHTSPFETGTYL